MKTIYLLIFFVSTGLMLRAQSNSTQTVNLTLTDVIDIIFTGTGSTTGSTLTLPFTTPDNYTNGVESTEQTLRVRSNKNFTVTAKTNASNFTYTGSVTPSPTMPVSGILLLKVSTNSTGGSIAGTFSGYTTLTSSNQNIITNGTRGNDQNFAIKYKGTPGFSYPAGTYSVNVIYTATQQ